MKHRLYLLINAVIYLGIAAMFFGGTADVAGRTLGISFAGPSGVTDFRATYAGLCLGIGLFFARAALRLADVPAAMTFAVFTYAGLGSVRIYGMIVDGVEGRTMLYLLAVEIVMFVSGALLGRGRA